MAGAGLGTRRQFLRAGAAAACGGALLAGCRRPAAPPPAPTVSQPIVTLTFMPWWIDWNASGRALLAQATEAFAAANPGLRATAVPGPNGGGVSPTDVVEGIVAGRGPDVVCDYGANLPGYMEAGLFADVGPFLRQDGVDPSVWSTAHLDALRTGQGQFGLPTYDGPAVYAYRQDILDQQGLPRPDPQWTYQQAAAFWRRCVGTVTVQGQARPRFGADIYWRDGWDGSGWLFTAFGGAEMDPGRTRALFSDPNSVAGGQWLLPLLWDGVVSRFGQGSLVDGTTAFSLRGGWMISRDVVAFGTRFPWDYMPVPVFPHGRATFGNDDYWGLNALGGNLRHAWTLMKWLAYENDWQRFCMRSALLGPCKISLWDEFEGVLRSYAPVLRDKAIQWYADAVRGGYGYARQYFRYQPIRSDERIAQAVLRLNAEQVQVQPAFEALATAVDALQTTGAAQYPARAARIDQARRLGASSVNAPLLAPTTFGLGVPPTPSPDLASQSGGAWTVSGAGTDVGGTSDNGAFAGLAETPSVAQFQCRVSALGNVDCPSLAPWCKVGLMARADLSDDAPMILLALTAGNGLQLLYRPAAAVAVQTRQSVAGARAGLIGPAALTAPDLQVKRANYLLRPVWLRIARQGNVWTASSSWDGQAWTSVGPPVSLLAAGAWIGLFVSAVNAAFPAGAGLRIRATFDHLSFAPAATYALGPP